MTSALTRRRFLFGRTPVAPPQVAAIGEGCLEIRGIVCRACGDSCDARAISFVPLAAGLARPRVGSGACTGCGDCIAVCPVAAITLESLHP